MSIKETVKQFIASYVEGNKAFTADQLVVLHEDGKDALITDDGTTPALNTVQISRALRDLPYVKRTIDRRYIVKGRRVSNETGKKLVKYRCDICHKWSTRINQLNGLCEHCASKRAVATVSTEMLKAA